MIKVDMETKVKFIHGFSHKTRLQILECLMNREKTVSEIIEEVGGSQSSISQHLACLKGCGLITSRQEGKYVYYKIRSEQIHELLRMFDDVLFEVEDDISTCKDHID